MSREEYVDASSSGTKVNPIQVGFVPNQLEMGFFGWCISGVQSCIHVVLRKDFVLGTLTYFYYE